MCHVQDSHLSTPVRSALSSSSVHFCFDTPSLHKWVQRHSLRMI